MIILAKKARVTDINKMKVSEIVKNLKRILDEKVPDDEISIIVADDYNKIPPAIRNKMVIMDTEVK